MKKILFVALASLSLGAGTVAIADKVHDWHDLDKVHDHVVESIHEMERARAANHYDMAGHGAKAEDQQGVGWTDDLDVETIGRVPPVVKGRRGKRGNAAPGCDEGA